MSSRSIVDRVLLFAAAVCAAGLVWQLTVLMTSKNSASTFHRLDSVTSASASAQPVGDPPAVAATTASPVRVVYSDGVSAKTVGKATDMADTVSTPSTPAALTGSASRPSADAALAPPASAGPGGLEPKSAEEALSGPPPDETSPAGAPPSPSAVPAPVTLANVSPAAPDAVPPPSQSDAKTTGKQTLNINQASIEALNHLPGGGRIGQAIASHRPYRSVEDLLKKRVVRRNVYDQIKGQLAAE